MSLDSCFPCDCNFPIAPVGEQGPPGVPGPVGPRGPTGPAGGAAGQIGVENVEALKAIDTAPLGSYAIIGTAGYWTAGDEGGALYYYVPGAVDVPDDALIILPDSGDGRFFLIHENRFNVRWWGAKGDGATDDATALEAASVAASTRPGIEWYLPRGTFVSTGVVNLYSGVLYRVHGTLTKPAGFRSDTVPPVGSTATPFSGFGMIAKGTRSTDVNGNPVIEYTNIHVVGDGVGVLDGNSTAAFSGWRAVSGGYCGIIIENCEHCSIKGLTIQNYPLATVKYACVVDGEFSGNKIRNKDGANEQVSSPATQGKNQDGFNTDTCQDIRVFSNDIWSIDDNIAVSSGVLSNVTVQLTKGISVFANQLQQTSPTTGTLQAQARNFVCYLNPLNLVSFLKNIYFGPANVCNAQGPGVMVGATAAAAGSHGAPDHIFNVSVNDNEFIDFTNDNSATIPLGQVRQVILARDCNNLTVRGNKLYNFSRKGIAVGGNKNWEVIGNEFRDQTMPTNPAALYDPVCIEIEMGLQGATNFKDSEGGIIADNIARHCAGGFIVASVPVTTNAVRRLTVSRNKAYDCAMANGRLSDPEYTGIYLSQIIDGIISDNEIIDCGGQGIVVIGLLAIAVDRVKIQRNTVRNAGKAATTGAFATVSRSRAANVATLVTATHSLVVGNQVIVSGLGGAGYNVTAPVTLVAGTDSTHIVYNNTGGNEGVTADAAGTVTPQAANTGIEVQRSASDTDFIDNVEMSDNTVTGSVSSGMLLLNVKAMNVRHNRLRDNAVTLAGNNGQLRVLIAGDGTPVNNKDTAGWSGVVEHNYFSGATSYGMTFVCANLLGSVYSGTPLFIRYNNFTGQTLSEASRNADLGYTGNMDVYRATQDPTFDASIQFWKQGDICWFTAPSAASPPGAICVTAGTAGTWKAMAALAA